MHFIWIGLLIFVVIIDLETSNVLFSWFGIGFLISFLLGYLGVRLEVQVATSAILSVPLFLLGSYISRKYIKANITPHQNSLDKLVNTVLISESDFDSEGKQKIGGVYWKLQSAAPVKVGDKIRISGRNGNHLIVEKILEEKEK